MKSDDRETRERLLSAAARLFAARGFAKVTVRDICDDAAANVAAVNYHFGGKQGLYDETLQTAMRIMQSTTDAARQAGEGRDPSGQLEAYISIFLERVAASRDGWIHQLMMRELTDPTPALDVVIAQVIRPRMMYLGQVIAALLGCDASDERVRLCVDSVNAQMLALLHNPVSDRLRPRRLMTPDHIAAMAAHISRFSLGGIQAVRS